MRQAIYALALLALTEICSQALVASTPIWAVHQSPDKDGIYYAGPEVTAPKMVKTVYVPYPYGSSPKESQGMTALAMVIDARGVPNNIQILRSHGDSFDRVSIAAVQQSTFQPATLAGKPVPVWIDVRVVFYEDHRQTTPQVLIAERDLPAPAESQFEDKHHNPLAFTSPVPIHTVDADFTDPFAKHPLVTVAVVSVLVGVDGLPKEVRIRRGLGFGLDQKATAAVWHYRFLPATKKGKPVEDLCDVTVNFAEF
jgi:TonB family protein